MKKILETVNAVMIVLMLCMTVGQILFRSVLKISASWSEELIQYSYAFVVFIGAIIVTKEESHITITMGLDMAPPSVRRIMRILGRLIIIPFLLFFSWGAFQNAQATWANSLPTVEWVKIGYMYAVLLVSGICMTVFVVMNTVLDMLGKLPTAPAAGEDK